MAAHDPRALEALQACQRAGLRVPHDISILGTNNDSITCELVSPSLSSIPRRGETVGFEAAKMLDELLRGEVPSAAEIVIPVDKAIDRESSALLSVHNPQLLKIIEYISSIFSLRLSLYIVVGLTCKDLLIKWLKITQMIKI